jgi:hypothetical protein
MSSEEIIRAWKDPDRRVDDGGVNHPAGDIELDYTGGQVSPMATEYMLSMGCACGGITNPTCITCACPPYSSNPQCTNMGTICI